MIIMIAWLQMNETHLVMPIKVSSMIVIVEDISTKTTKYAKGKNVKKKENLLVLLRPHGYRKDEYQQII